MINAPHQQVVRQEKKPGAHQAPQMLEDMSADDNVETDASKVVQMASAKLSAPMTAISNAPRRQIVRQEVQLDEHQAPQMLEDMSADDNVETDASKVVQMASANLSAPMTAPEDMSVDDKVETDSAKV